MKANQGNRWDKKTFDAAQEERKYQEAPMRPNFREKPARDRESIAEQAKALLDGQTKWRSTPQGNQWQNVGGELEVETDVDISQANKQ